MRLFVSLADASIDIPELKVKLPIQKVDLSGKDVQKGEYRKPKAKPVVIQSKLPADVRAALHAGESVKRLKPIGSVVEVPPPKPAIQQPAKPEIQQVPKSAVQPPPKPVQVQAEIQQHAIVENQSP